MLAPDGVPAEGEDAIRGKSQQRQASPVGATEISHGPTSSHADTSDGPLNCPRGASPSKMDQNSLLLHILRRLARELAG
jgi:hypothetical protein